MEFNPNMVIKTRLLTQPIDGGIVAKLPKQAGARAGKEYVKTSKAILKANELTDMGWSSEVKSCEVLAIETLEKTSDYNGQTKHYTVQSVTCAATVKVCFHGFLPHEDVGIVTAEAKTKGDAIDMAYKGAASDALKRALRHYGAQFGVTLMDADDPYGETYAEKMAAECATPPAAPAEVATPPQAPTPAPAPVAQAVTPAPVAAPTTTAPASAELIANAGQAIRDFKAAFGSLPKACEAAGIKSPGAFNTMNEQQLTALLDAIRSEAQSRSNK